MSYPVTLMSVWANNDNIHTIDIREDSRARMKWYYWNYLEFNLNWVYDIIITNPPFNIAQQIIERALLDVKEWWYVIMLLRLNYFWSVWRFPFWKKNMPHSTYIHHKRMSFTDDWKTDSIEYMHCVWKRWEKNTSTKLYII